MPYTVSMRSKAGSTARNLRADALHVRGDGAVVDHHVGVAHQRVAVLHVAGMARERVHHPELGQREVDGRAAPGRGHALRRRARAARARCTSSAGAAAPRAASHAAEERGDAREQVRQAHVLGEVVVGAQAQARRRCRSRESRADRKMIGSVADSARSSRHSAKPPSISSPRPMSMIARSGRRVRKRAHARRPVGDRPHLVAVRARARRRSSARMVGSSSTMRDAALRCPRDYTASRGHVDFRELIARFSYRAQFDRDPVLCPGLPHFLAAPPALHPPRRMRARNGSRRCAAGGRPGNGPQPDHGPTDRQMER